VRNLEDSLVGLSNRRLALFQNDVGVGGSLPDDFYDEFIVNAFIAEELKPNQTLAFTVTQDCEKGQMTWSETAPPEHQLHLKWPAPLLKILPKASEHDH